MKITKIKLIQIDLSGNLFKDINNNVIYNKYGKIVFKM